MEVIITTKELLLKSGCDGWTIVGDIWSWGGSGPLVVCLAWRGFLCHGVLVLPAGKSCALLVGRVRSPVHCHMAVVLPSFCGSRARPCSFPAGAHVRPLAERVGVSQLEGELQQRQSAGIADSITQSCSSEKRHGLRFAKKRASFPAQQSAQLMLFVTFLAGQGLSCRAFKCYLAAVWHLYIL